MNAEGTFKSRAAPCGRMVDGETFEDHDEEVVVTREVRFSCGCLRIQHEYHDGTVSLRVVRHDGRVVEEELDSAE